MNPTELRHKERIKKVLTAIDNVAKELYGTELADEEFKSLSKKLNNLMKIVYQQRSQRSQAAAVAFNEAMHTLQTIRTKS